MQGIDAAYIAKIRLGGNLNPYYAYTFFQTKYGQNFMRREARGSVQQHVFLSQIEQIAVPLFSTKFYERIEQLNRTAFSFVEQSRRLFTDTEDILLSELNFNLDEMSTESISEKSFSESFAASGRLDAEYYLPKYESIQRALNTKDTVRTLCKLHDRTFLPKPNEEYRYIELADVGISGFIADVESQRGVDLPTRARRKVKRGQVIVSSVEGSLQSCALITDEYDNALCSTGFYVVDSAKINPETLLVLFIGNFR